MNGVWTVSYLALVAGICRATDLKPRFEVASVKPVEVDNPRIVQRAEHRVDSSPFPGFLGTHGGGNRVELHGFTLEQLIAIAFRMRTRQIVGPGWLKDKAFDLEALIPAEASHKDVNEML